MNRRDLLRLGGSTLLLGALPPLPHAVLAGGQRAEPARLFFDPEAIPRIRANARTPLLRPAYEAWQAEGTDALYAAVDKAVASGNLVYDFAGAMEALTRVALIHLVEPSERRRAALHDAITAAVGLPKWDYFYDGDAPIGIQRAPLANARLLFAREVLSDKLDAALEERLLGAIAEKGCLPCYRTIAGMDRPDAVMGWRFDRRHEDLFEYDLSRWPEILGAVNLRAVPTMGLGLGALALRERDGRAGLWLDTAVSSAKRFLGFLSADGSYFEGLSYVDYSFRTLFAFLEAHERLEGGVDWASATNFEGVARFILAMQAGRRCRGGPDVVNFSDASRSVYPCVPAWIARKTGSGLAQYAAEHAAHPGFYLDFLWYDPERASAAPPPQLKNARLDLDWVVCRSGWAAGDAVLAFRSGRPANHEHADRNSFLYKIHGERLLTDHFGAAYARRDPKWLLRLTEAHNAILIDGKGHQYHEGEEGTNESQAEAALVRFEEDGDRVWWCSDATGAYALVDDDVARVRRTVLFAKPDVVVLLDQIEKRSAPSRVAVRFFPDNRDGAATVDAESDAFSIRRPRATLYGWTRARSELALTPGRLDLDAELGVYPYLEVAADAARAHEVVTVLVARPAGDTGVPTMNVQPEADGWALAIGDVRARIGSVDGGPLGSVPEVTWL